MSDTSSSICYVLWEGSNIVTGFYGQNMFFETGIARWVNYGDFLKSFADEEGNVPANFTIENIIYPDTP